MVYLTFDNVAFNAEYGDRKDYLTEAVLSQEVRRAKLQRSEDVLGDKGKASYGEVRSADKQQRGRQNKPGIRRLRVRASRVCLFCKLDHQLPYGRKMARTRSRERRRTRSRSKDVPNKKSLPRWTTAEKTEQHIARNAGSRLSPRRRSRRHDYSRRAESSPKRSPERSAEKTIDDPTDKPIKPKRTPITPPEDKPAKRTRTGPDTPMPAPPPSVQTPPERMEKRHLPDIKDSYRFGGAYTSVELISEVSLERVDQAAGYGHVWVNFMGSRRNFEHVMDDQRSEAEVALARNNDEKRALWRARMLSHGQAVDLTMMICHPEIYDSMVAANPRYTCGAVSEADQLRALGIFEVMAAKMKIRHAMNVSNLPDMGRWDEVMARHPAGPKSLSVLLSMLEKLDKFGEISVLITDMMRSLSTPEVKLPMAKRLGARIMNERSLQVSNRIHDARRNVKPSSSCVGTGKSTTRLGEVRLTRGTAGRVVSIPEDVEAGVEMSDLDQAEMTVKNIVFEDYQAYVDSDIEILDPKPMLAVKEEVVEMETGKVVAENVVVSPEPIQEHILEPMLQAEVTSTSSQGIRVGNTSSFQSRISVSEPQEPKEPSRGQELLVGAGMCTGRPAGMSDSDPGDSDYGQYSDGFVSNAVNAYDGVA
jgi:hypothetical protein